MGEEVLPKLLQLPESNDELRMGAIRAMGMISNQKFGVDLKKWREYIAAIEERRAKQKQSAAAPKRRQHGVGQPVDPVHLGAGGSRGSV